MKKLVVFDIAGTTLQDFDIVNNAFTQAFNHYNLFPTKEQISKVMGLSKPIAIDLVLKEIENPSGFSVNKIHDVFLTNIKNHYKNEKVDEISGTSNIFKVLHERGYKVALDTGFSRDITQIILDKVGWQRDHLIDAVISSDQVPAGRPFPYMIFKLMEGLGIQKTKDVVKVGDTVSDLQEGLNAGCGVVIGVTSGTYSRAELKECSGEFYILPDVTYVPSLLEAIKDHDFR